MKSTPMILSLFVVLCAAGLGCEGKIGLDGAEGIAQFKPPGTTTEPDIDPDGEPPDGTMPRPGVDPTSDDVCKLINPGTTPVRRLTADEYTNSVRDLFPDITIPAQTLGSDERISGFTANTVSSVGSLQAEEYQLAAEAIAALVVAGRNAAEVDPATAMRAFIEDTGKRAYRRPLTTEEIDGLFALYTLGETEYDATTGKQMVIEAILQSPAFLYRVEVGEESTDEVVALTSFEVASRLSYYLWGTIPDAALITAAEAGELSTPEQVEAQARRMIADPKARLRIDEAFAQWLRIDELDQFDNPDPDFTNEVRSSMVNETRTFIDHVVWESPNSTVAELLTADYTFVDANTAALYGLEGGAADGMVRATLPTNRRGILSHPGVLTMHGHGQAPVYRGKFVREAFLCASNVADPPPDVIEPLPSFEGESNRSKSTKRLEARVEGCAGCHVMMDSVGLVFDNFDSLGRYQTQDEFGNDLTADGEVLVTRETNGPVNGVLELAEKLAGSPDVSECVSAQFFRYAFARTNEREVDACSLSIVNAAAEASGNDIKEMLVAVVTTDAFLYRRNLSLSQ